MKRLTIVVGTVVAASCSPGSGTSLPAEMDASQEARTALPSLDAAREAAEDIDTGSDTRRETNLDANPDAGPDASLVSSTLARCPAAAREGGECVRGGADGLLFYDCRLSDERCSDLLHCIGNIRGSRYVRIDVVRDGCPIDTCPRTYPSGSCGRDQFCDYPHGSDAVPGRIFCECSEGGEWDCLDNDPCPSVAPADGDPVNRTPFSVPWTCYYGPEGEDVCRVDTATDPWTWRCAFRDRFECPLVAPASGAECTVPSDCRYLGRLELSEPVTTYRGTCVCDGSTWTCTPNETATCPDAQPRATDFCAMSAGSSHCWYPNPTGTRGTNCHCDPPAPRLWICDETERF